LLGAFLLSLSEMSMTLKKTLKKRKQYLAANSAPYQARPSVVVQSRARYDDSVHIGLGFTATKKTGNAVMRKRAKRRLREAARTLIDVYGIAGHDYVFIARETTKSCEWQGLLDDVKRALIRLSTKPDKATRPTLNSSVLRSPVDEA
jgi:ribonuclease P protein component